MPIKGLTDRLRMPRAGKIHLGVKSTSNSGAEYPTPTDYFVVPQEVIDAIGDPQPKELNIMFPTEEPEQFAPTYLKLFSRTRGLVCKGDGEWADRTVNMRAILGADGVIPDGVKQPEDWPVVDRDAKPEDIQRVMIQCRGEGCPQYGKTGCGRMMMLQFLLPDVPGLGIYQIDTGSRNGVQNIYGALELVRAYYGRVSMIPLKLRIGPIQTVSPDTGRQQTNYVLSLDCDLSLNALSQYKSMGPAPDLSTRQLPDPDDELPYDLIPASVLEAEETSGLTALPGPVDDVPQVHNTVEAALAGTKIMEPPTKPKPTPKPKADVTVPAYGEDLWLLSVAEMGQRLVQRRNELGITPEVLREQAESIGLDNPQKMKHDQFIYLMDWMRDTFGPQDPIMPEGVEAGLIDPEPRKPEDPNAGYESKPGIDPEASLEDLLLGVTEEYTWSQALEVASLMGIRSRKKLETEVLKMSVKEWDKLEGTPASATKRLLRMMIEKRDGAANPTGIAS